MADINIYGKLVNKTSNGILADSNQILYKEHEDGTIESVYDKLENFEPVKTYENFSEASVDAGNLKPGSLVSVKGDSTDDYKNDYTLYVVVESKSGYNTLKEFKGGSGDGGSTYQLTFLVNASGTGLEEIEGGKNSYECPIGTVIKFSCIFYSQYYGDARGTIYGRVNNVQTFNQKVYPNSPTETAAIWTYDTSSLKTGQYTFTLYGQDSSGKLSDRVNISVRVGGLNISSTFVDGKPVECSNENNTAIEDLEIPISITSADTSSKLFLDLTLNNEKIKDTEEIHYTTKSIIIPKEKIIVGVNSLSIQLKNDKNKASNILNYKIIGAINGKLYLTSDSMNYQISSGNIFSMFVGLIQLNYQSAKFNVSILIKNSNNEEVFNSVFNKPYGLTNLIEIPGLKFKSEDGITNESDSDYNKDKGFIGKYTKYTIRIGSYAIGGTDETVLENIILKVYENQYSLSFAGSESLLCSFNAEGKTNSSLDKDVWIDESGNGNTVTFTNFNWKDDGNGWVRDDKNGTALALNGGAFARINLAPFFYYHAKNDSKEEIDKENANITIDIDDTTDPSPSGNGLTISIDFETKNILDSDARVISCMEEQSGSEEVEYYLFDNYGEYVEKDPDDAVFKEEFYYPDPNDLTKISRVTTSSTDGYQLFDYTQEVYYYTDVNNATIYTFDSTRKIENVLVYVKESSGNYSVRILTLKNYEETKNTTEYYLYIPPISEEESATYERIETTTDIKTTTAYSVSNENNKPFTFKFSNIIRYFMYTGGYCWINGQTYTANGSTIYNYTMDLNNRTLNYNLGTPNKENTDPDTLKNGKYIDEDGNVTFAKYSGKSVQDVILQKGFYIDTRNAVLSTYTSPSEVDDKFHLSFSENEKTHLDLVINRVEGSDPSRAAGYLYNNILVGYTNGCLSLLEKFSSDFATNSNTYIYLGGRGVIDSGTKVETVDKMGECKIYSLKIYNRALSTDEILNNYAAGIIDEDERKDFIDNNGGAGSDGFLKTGTNASMPQKLPIVTLIGADMGGGHYSIEDFIMQLANTSSSQVAELKSIKRPAYMTYYDPILGEFWTGSKGLSSQIPIRLQFQGTSSMVYPCKNYKIKLYDPDTADSSGVVGFKITNGAVKYGKKLKKDINNSQVKENTFCLKADFMDSSHCNNTGCANFISFYNGIISGKTPASEIFENARTTIYGYPCLVYYKLHENIPDSEKKFLGVYNFNLDKSCTDSYGLDKNVEIRTDLENKGVKYDFGQSQFIDDDFSKDILIKTDKKITLPDGNTTKEYIAMQDPTTGKIVAALSEKGYLRSLNNDEISNTFCVEVKANSSRGSAGGFGSYLMNQVNSDFEMRYEDEGDLEDEQYADYTKRVGSTNAESFKDFKQPYFYHLRRFIKWISSCDEEKFLKEYDLHLNPAYYLDYYLTFFLLGGVDSLGKNLMFGTWGPENHLYLANEDDENSILYPLSNGTQIRISPIKQIITTTITDMAGISTVEKKFQYAKDENGKLLYYKEEAGQRYTESGGGFTRRYPTAAELEANNFKIISTTPGEAIWYPTYYDIDTVGGLDNSGHLVFDTDIEVGQNLDNGKITYNTADSWLWTSIRDWVGKRDPKTGLSKLADRWATWNSTFNVYDELVGTYFYKNEISKIPVKYYNDDTYVKYLWEGPNKQIKIGKDQFEYETNSTETGIEKSIKNSIGLTNGAYLYCVHGNRYEQIKRWYRERIAFINSYFAQFGSKNASMRSRSTGYDPNYDDDTENYYITYNNDGSKTYNYALLAQKENGKYYSYDEENNTLTTKFTSEDGKNVLNVVTPFEFAFKTYYPAYVGVKYFNNGRIHMIKVPRNKTAYISGNIKTSSDQEVFIYGDQSIKEIGNISKYFIQSCDISNLNKLVKLDIGTSENSGPIETLAGLSGNQYLSELNLEGCASLKGTLDISGCKNLKVLNLKGSSISSVKLYSGGALERFIIPDTISSIELNNLANIKYLNYTSLGKLTSISISDCPKLQGYPAETNKGYNSTIWNLLNSTQISPIDNTEGKKSINVEAYGELNESSTGFLFLDKYYNYFTSENIKGELRYTGSKLPQNYTKFKTAYPNLKIEYTNASDFSGMFENYKNIDAIGYFAQAYTGLDSFGNPKYDGSFYYWVSNDGWDSSKYICESTYNSKTTEFYIDTNTNKYYRLLKIHDDNDLNLVRQQIKECLANFTRATSLNRMFANLTILDYLDPDTFNGIDLSNATTDEMFLNCTSLKYFNVPGDSVKNYKKIQYTYEGKELSETEYNELSEEEQAKVEKTERYFDKIDNIFVDSEYTIHPVGMQKLGENMFFNCKQAKIFIPKLSNNSKITISNTAFKYNIYTTDTNNTNNRNATIDRPVILFEATQDEITEIKNDPNGSTDEFGNPKKVRLIKANNPFIDFQGNYNEWLREVYYNIEKLIFDDADAETGAIISYALTKNSEKILFELKEQPNYKLQRFNFRNKLNIISETVGSIKLKNLPNLDNMFFVAPNFDCLDLINPLFDIETRAYPVFCDSTNNTADYFNKPETILKCGLTDLALNRIYIRHFNNEIPENYYQYLPFLKDVSIENTITKINSQAFASSSIQIMTFYKLEGEKLNYINLDQAKANINKNSSLIEISNSAFQSSKLTKFIMPDSVETLGDSVFNTCTKLSTIYLSENELIKKIPIQTFYNCPSLVNIYLNKINIEEICSDAFYNCSQLNINGDGSTTELTQLFLNDFINLKTIGSGAFFGVSTLGKSNIQFNITPTLTSIGDNAFFISVLQNPDKFFYINWVNDPINSNLIPNDYNELVIGNGAFSYLFMQTSINENKRDNLPSLYVPKVKSIGIGAFKQFNEGQNKFKYCLMRNSEEEIGSTWIKNSENDQVEHSKKIIYNYLGQTVNYEGNNNDYTLTYLISTSLNNNGNEIFKRIPWTDKFEDYQNSHLYTYNSENGSYTEITSTEGLNITDCFVKISGTAYLYKLKTNFSSFTLRTFIKHENKFYQIIEISENAFDDVSDGGISVFSYYSDTALTLIESGIFTSKLSAIQQYNPKTIEGEGNILQNVIPDDLVIKSGNKFKSSVWYNNIIENLKENKLITLGKYIIGLYVNTQSDYELDLSTEENKNLSVIYDGAFDGITQLKSVRFRTFNTKTEGSLDIYESAFAGCVNLNKINFKGTNIHIIGQSAFSQCPFRELFLPNTITEIGDNAFTAVPESGLGYLRKLEIEDGANFVCNTFITPYTEININNSQLTTVANISLNELHIPSSMSKLLSRTNFSPFVTLSQIHHLYLGPLKINDDETETGTYTDYYGEEQPYKGSIYCKNIPIYKNEDGTKTFKEIEGQEPTEYCPLFFYNLMKRLNNISFALTLTTTESHGVCPLGDTEEYKGVAEDIDIRTIYKYPENQIAYVNGSIPDQISSVLGENYRALNREDLLRIISGFSLSALKDRTYNITLFQNGQNNLFNSADKVYLTTLGYNINFVTGS